MNNKRLNNPWIPPQWDEADAVALQALCSGTANEGQQQRAISWIINTACATYDLPYRPESARDTDFALGKQFVGQQIVKLTKIKIGIIQENLKQQKALSNDGRKPKRTTKQSTR